MPAPLVLPTAADLTGATVTLDVAEIAGLPAHSGRLSADEIARAHRQRPPGATERWMGVWSWVRRLLGDHLGMSPARVPIVRDDHGRPRLADPECGWDFNISHAGGLVALAIADRPVGVDIEAEYRGTDLLELARIVAHPDELASLTDADVTGRRHGFARMWTRKEALLKGIGSGFLREPRTVLVGTGPEPVPHERWVVVDLTAQTTSAGVMHGAVAVARACPRSPEVNC